ADLRFDLRPPGDLAGPQDDLLLVRSPGRRGRRRRLQLHRGRQLGDEQAGADPADRVLDRGGGWHGLRHLPRTKGRTTPGQPASGQGRLIRPWTPRGTPSRLTSPHPLVEYYRPRRAREGGKARAQTGGRRNRRTVPPPSRFTGDHVRVATRSAVPAL